MIVLYEDHQIAVVVKPIGVSSEEAQDGKSVPALLRDLWKNEKAYVGVIHRLDTGVGGVMVYAKTQQAAADLSRQVQERSFEKEYRCVCAGVPEPAQGEMRDSRSKAREEARRKRFLNIPLNRQEHWKVRKSRCAGCCCIPGAHIRCACSSPAASIRCWATANTAAA